jgi:hypothetical protein
MSSTRNNNTNNPLNYYESEGVNSLKRKPAHTRPPSTELKQKGSNLLPPRVVTPNIPKAPKPSS